MQRICNFIAKWMGLTWAFSLPQELAKGDLALSVGMTAASTVLAPLLSIVYIVILPIVCGLLCQRFIPKIT